MENGSQKYQNTLENYSEIIIKIKMKCKYIKKSFENYSTFTWYFRPCECGIKPQEDPNKPYPWQVFLTINWKPEKPNSVNVFCQGVLISKKHILTAKRCFENNPIKHPNQQVEIEN